MSPVIQSATEELRQLAAKMRPDWDTARLDGLFVAAAQAGWSFNRTFTALAPILCAEDGEPGDLERAIAASVPLRRGTALPGDANAVRAAEVRNAMYEGLARLHNEPEPEREAS